MGAGRSRESDHTIGESRRARCGRIGRSCAAPAVESSFATEASSFTGRSKPIGVNGIRRGASRDKSQAMLEKMRKYWRRTKISPISAARTEVLSRSPVAPKAVPQAESTPAPGAKPGTCDATYRVWEKDGVWCWEVSSKAGHNLGFGRTASSVKARAAAFQIWLGMQ
jgi:hypothetical protein